MATHFLLLGRTGDRDFGLELREILQFKPILSICLPSLLASIGRAYAIETLKLC